MENNYQRIGSASNSSVGQEFEKAAQVFFAKQGVELTSAFSVRVGVTAEKRARRFDLGSADPPVLVECKSHTWTVGGNVPSAKITVWTEAMYYFLLAPERFRKVLFVLRDFSTRHGETLAEYYLRTHGHLVPAAVEVIEYDPSDGSSRVLTAAH